MIAATLDLLKERLGFLDITQFQRDLRFIVEGAEVSRRDSEGGIKLGERGFGVAGGIERPTVSCEHIGVVGHKAGRLLQCVQAARREIVAFLGVKQGEQFLKVGIVS